MFFEVRGQSCPKVVPRLPPGTLQGQMLSKSEQKIMPRTIFLWCVLGGLSGIPTGIPIFWNFCRHKKDIKIIAKSCQKWSRNGHTNTTHATKLTNTSWKKRGMKTCAHKWQNKMTHKPSKAWFSTPLWNRIVVSTFPHLLRMSTELLQRAFEIEANRCLWHQKDIKREVQKTS